MERRIAEEILLVVSATAFFASIFGWYGSTLPEYYESKAFLIIKPPQISGKVIASLTEELEQKLVIMNQDVLSNIALETMISKYKLFESEKSELMPTELIIEKMRRNISVKIEKERDRVTGFSITYRDTNPEKTQKVAAELAERYINSAVCCQCKDFDDLTRETIRIVGAANLPQSPISRMWLNLTLVGAGFGFFIGLIVLGLSQLANIVRTRFAELDLQ